MRSRLAVFLVIWVMTLGLAQAQSPKVAFDNNLTPNQVVKGVVRLFGFARTTNSQGYVEVAVDGQRIGRPAYPLFRTDVPNSGWGMELDTEAFANGNRLIEAFGYEKSGQLVESARLTLNFRNTPLRGVIESPGWRDPASGEIGIAGWALAEGGLKSMEILINGQRVADAQLGLPRSDVQAVFPEYGNATSGFRAVVNLGRLDLPRGFHRVDAVGITSAGDRKRMATSEIFHTAGRVGRSYVDFPTINGSAEPAPSGLRVAGWSEGVSPARYVDVWLNDRPLGRVDGMFDNRPDVPPVFPAVTNVRGFDTTLDVRTLVSGPNRIRMVATDFSGIRTNLDTFTGPVQFTALKAPKLFGAHLRPANDYGGSIQIYRNEMFAPDVVMYFQPWRTSSGACSPLNEYPYLPQRVTEAGAIPMITWEPLQEGASSQANFKLASILAGAHDECVRAYARQVKEFGQPVMIRFAHEFNGNSNHWTGDSNGRDPALYVAVWRKVVDMFNAEGATNALWVWSPDHASPPEVPQPASDLRNYYPGDAYVDYIGVSGYNWGNDPLRGGGWVTPQQVFRTFLDLVKRDFPGKGVLITEVGSVKGYGDFSRAQWYQEFFDYINTRTEVKGVIWFNDYAFANTSMPDFRVTNTPGFPAVNAAESAAFRAAAQGFRGTKN